MGSCRDPLNQALEPPGGAQKKGRRVCYECDWCGGLDFRRLFRRAADNVQEHGTPSMQFGHALVFYAPLAALWGVRVGGVALWLSKAEIDFHTDDAKSGQIAQTSEKDT
jgi:hypothetical protein